MKSKYIPRHSKEYFKSTVEKELSIVQSTKFISKSATILGITAIISTPLINTTQVLATEMESYPSTNIKNYTGLNIQNQAQQQIDEAQKALDEANQVANDAKQQLDQTTEELNAAQDETNAAQEALDQKNAEQSALEAQQAELQKKSELEREQEILDQQTLIEKDLQSVSDAENAKLQAEKDQLDADNAYQTAVDAQNDQQLVVNDKKAEFDEAQAKYDNINPETLQKAVDEAQAKVNADQSIADGALVTKDQMQSELDAANISVQAAENKVNQTQAELDAAKGTVNESAANKSAIQAQIDALEAQIKATSIKAANLIQVPDGLTQELYATYQNAILDQLSTEAYQANKYKYNAEDAAKKLDISNLTPEYSKEINDYVFDLINNIRQQMGLPLVKQTVGSMDFAKFVADNHSTGFNHDTNALNNAVLQFGVNFSTESLFGSQSSQTNMNTVKQSLYNMVMMSMFADKDQGYGHTNTIINFKNPTDIMQIGTAYDSYGQMHIISIKDTEAAKGNKFTKSMVYDNTQTGYTFTSKADLEKQVADMQAQLTQLQNDLLAAQQTYDTAVQTVTLKEAQLVAAKADLTSKTVTQADALAKLTQAQTELQAATDQLNASKSTLTIAQSELADIELAKANAKSLLDQTSSALSVEMNKLNNLTSITNDKKELLAQANLVLDEKINEVKAAIDKLNVDIVTKTVMENELQLLLDISQKLETVKNEVLDAQGKLDAANANLADVKVKYGTDSIEYSIALAKVKEAEDNLTKAKNALNSIVEKEKLEDIIKETEQKETIHVEKSNLTKDSKNNMKPLFTNLSNTDVTSINNKNSSVKISKSSLPQTGSIDNFIFNTLGISLLAFAALLKKKLIK